MAKKNTSNLLPPPKFPVKGLLSADGFAQVTEQNRKQAIVLGRIIYLFKVEAKNELLLCCDINPPLKKGWHEIPHYPWHYDRPNINGATHWKCFYDEDTDYDEWAKNWKRMIDDGIAKKQLYIRVTDPILIYK